MIRDVFGRICQSHGVALQANYRPVKTLRGQDNGEKYVKKTRGFHIRIGTPSAIVNAVYVTGTHKDLAN